MLNKTNTVDAKFNSVKFHPQRVYSPLLFEVGGEETDGYFDPQLYHKVLKGELIFYHAKNIIPLDHCEQICKSFINYPVKTQYSVRPTIQAIGKALYFAEQDWLQAYFNSASKIQSELDNIFNASNTPNYLEQLYTTICDYFSINGGLARKLHYHGQDGFYGIMRSWGNIDVDESGHATRLHEDRLQIRLHDQHLETREVFNSTLVSTCLYYGNCTHGGELVIYDLRPGLEDAELEMMDSEYKYGFDISLAHNLKSLTITPRQGDIISFCADRLHIVNGFHGGMRITSSFFSSIKENDNKVSLIWS